jgi:hypothetical protein
LDRDDGRWVYEVEFREGRTEYTVRASDGKVVDYDKDRDDENTSKKEAGNGFFFCAFVEDFHVFRVTSLCVCADIRSRLMQ